MNSIWTRRAWLTTAATHTGALVALFPGHDWLRHTGVMFPGAHIRGGTARSTPTPAATHPADPARLEALAKRAVEAAQAAGARYADARLTRIVVHRYWVADFAYEIELVGVGVRAVTTGAWGFAATPLWLDDPTAQDAVVRVAQDAVLQSKATAGPHPPIELAPAPAVQGRWQTPIKIDPFTISIEEKLATLLYWKKLAPEYDLNVGAGFSYVTFAREERVLATTEGTLLQQTFFETDGLVPVTPTDVQSRVMWFVEGLTPTAKGWELFDDIDLPGQLARRQQEYPEAKRLMATLRPGNIGRSTVVCDGATTASILHGTLGTGTQLDRALGYDANAEGASFVTDPLRDLGQLRLGSELITVTCDRSAPHQLGTAKWDDEGVVPEPFSVVQRGVLTDFQTTREQALWLAPAYERLGRPMRSHGCAGAESALFRTIQHMPNMALQAGPAAVQLEALIADVKDGVLLEGGTIQQMDSNGRTGLVEGGRMRKITNGRLGPLVGNLGLLFDTMDLWKNVIAIGGPSTQSVVGYSSYNPDFMLSGWIADVGMTKGMPAQAACTSTQAVATVIQKQPLINVLRKA